MRFNPDFEKGFPNKETRDRFVANIEAEASKYSTALQHVVDILNNQRNWRDFISTAFFWKDTPEYRFNPVYWSQVADGGCPSLDSEISPSIINNYKKVCR